MGLNEKKDYTYVQVKLGELVIKKDGNIKKFESLTGKITKVSFAIEEYEGKKFEKATFSIIDNDADVFMLQMTTDSGYFRGLCNSLKTSETPTEEISIIPKHTKSNGGKPKTTCIVEQNKNALKHAFTINNMGDLPELEIRDYKGEKLYDNSNQIVYWKNWLLKTFEPVVTNSAPSTVDAAPETTDDLPLN